MKLSCNLWRNIQLKNVTGLILQAAAMTFLKKRNDAVTAHLRIIMSRDCLQLKASLRNSNSRKLNMCNESDIVSVYVCINGLEREGEICRGEAALTEEVLSLSAGKTVCFHLLNLSISQPSLPWFNSSVSAEKEENCSSSPTGALTGPCFPVWFSRLSDPCDSSLDNNESLLSLMSPSSSSQNGGKNRAGPLASAERAGASLIMSDANWRLW